MNKVEKRIRKATFANVEEEFFEIDKENRIATKINGINILYFNNIINYNIC